MSVWLQLLSETNRLEAGVARECLGMDVKRYRVGQVILHNMQLGVGVYGVSA